MKRTTIMYLAAALLLPATACTKGGKQGEGGKRRGNGEGAQVPVEAATVEAKDLPQTIEIVSVLTGRKQAEVYSRAAGKISAIGPSEGARVKAGEVLFRVDRSEPGESFLATPVVSPINGWVGRWHVTSIGEQVTAQQAIVTVVDDEALRASVQVPTQEWLLVSSATPVRVRVGTDVKQAKVVGVSRSAEGSSSRGTVTVEIPNSEHHWKAGMVAIVAFDLDTKPRVVIPTSALSITDQGAFVFTVEEGKAKRQRVKFNAVDNDHVEILEGLSAGATVVTEGVSQIGDEVALKVVEKGAERKQ